MKFSRFVVALATLLCSVGSVSAGDDVDTKRLTLVEENHAQLTIQNVPYTLDSYIIMFQQPYYVKVKRDDLKPIPFEVAVAVAKEYIQPRGCTEPISRATSLDKSNSDNSQWLIGILC